MPRDPATSERTAAFHSQQTYESESLYDHAYLGSDLVQGVLSQIGDEPTEVSEALVGDIVDFLDEDGSGVPREQVLEEFSERRSAADRALRRLQYYSITMEAEQTGETIVGLHPNGEVAARRGYERDRTRRAALE